MTGIIKLVTGRIIEVKDFGRDELASSLSEALRAQVPWSVLDRNDRIVSINPFAVETIEETLRS